MLFFYLTTKVRKLDPASEKLTKKLSQMEKVMLMYQEKGALPPSLRSSPEVYTPQHCRVGLQYQECLSGAKKTEGKRVRNELFFSAEIRSAYTCRASWGYGLKVAQAGSTKARVSEATS